MKKRIISAVTVALLLFAIIPGASAASGSLSNFMQVHSYQSGRFVDISPSKWYAPYVQAAYEYGLINGKTPAIFDPDAPLTVAEAVKLAVCLNSIYYTGSVTVSNGTGGEPWYRPYADAALAAGIVSSDDADYNAPITRSEFALILSEALPDAALEQKNTVDDGAIPDISQGSAYAAAVYRLYRAGVLTGSDYKGSFLPDDNIRRSEVAAVVARMANAEFRRSVTLELQLSAAQIYDKCGPAVFYIEISDIKGTPVKNRQRLLYQRHRPGRHQLPCDCRGGLGHRHHARRQRVSRNRRLRLRREAGPGARAGRRYRLPRP
jgi:hypothetical protein